MAGFKFHKVAAIVVLIAFALWMGTGTFSSVGSAAAEGEQKQVDVKAEEANDAAASAQRTVAVVSPPRIQHARAIHVAGLTEADKRAVVATRAAGVITELPIHDGDHVKKDQPLLVLDPEDKPATVAMAEQVVKQREAELAAPKLQLDTVVSALALARSQLKAAETDLDRMTIRAPFDGVIDKVDVELGSSVAQGVGFATLLSLNPIVVKGEISERDLRYAKIGDEASVTLVNGQIVTGTVRYMSREATAATRTFGIEVSVDNPDDRIPAGMTAEILVRGENTESVILPRSVVTLSSNGDLGIRAVDKDNKIVFFPIDLVDDTPNGLVLAGIPADARVVVAGQDLVADGDLVTPVAADESMIRKLVSEPASLN
jgi:multidrug efflux system membrane fusion protein